MTNKFNNTQTKKFLKSNKNFLSFKNGINYLKLNIQLPFVQFFLQKGFFIYSF